MRVPSLPSSATALVVAALLSGATSAEAAQARVKIQDGNVVLADGTPMRAAPFFMGIFNTWHMRENETLYRDYFRSVSRDYGMNAVRICPWVGNWDYDIKNNAHHQGEYLYMIDKCVQWAAEDNIIAVVNQHTQYNTVLTAAKAKEFWDVCGARYKDQTHVVYEAVNEPNVVSAKTHMTQIYSDLRAMAPDTHIILWSLAEVGVNNNDFVLQDLRNASGITYSNASFGFHIYDWQLGDNRRWERAKSYRDAGYPVICTELMSFQDADNLPIYYPYLVDNIGRARQYGMSWMQWAPRFNYAGLDQYGTNHLQHADIAFTQTYKDELLAKGINFWSSTAVDDLTGITAPASVATGSGTARVSVNLTTAGSGRHVWAGIYDKDWVQKGGGSADVSGSTVSVDISYSGLTAGPANFWVGLYSPNWGTTYDSIAGQAPISASNLNGTYELKCKWGGFALAMPGSSPWPTALVMANPAEDSKQRWILEQVSGNTYRLRNGVANNLYMNGSNVAWANVSAGPLDTSWSSMQWVVENVSGSDYRLKNAWSGHYMSGSNTSSAPDNIVRTAPLDSTWNSMIWTLNQK